MKEKTVEEINDESITSPDFFTDAIEYLNEFQRQLPKKIEQAMPDSIHTMDDAYHNYYLAITIVAETMTIDECCRLVSYAKRFNVFNILVKYFLRQEYLPEATALAQIIASYIIDIMLYVNNGMLKEALDAKAKKEETHDSETSKG